MNDAKALVLKFVEDVWNRADAESLDRLTTDSYTYHLGGQPHDKAAMLAFVKAVHGAFSDWRVTVEDTVVDSDSAAIRWTGQVTHDGPFHGIPPDRQASHRLRDQPLHDPGRPNRQGIRADGLPQYAHANGRPATSEVVGRFHGLISTGI